MSNGDWIAFGTLTLTLILAIISGWNRLQGNKQHAAAELSKRIAEEHRHAEEENLKLWDETRRLQAEIDTVHRENGCELKECVSAFTTTCDTLRRNMEELSVTISGQYVPRQEIDARFNRYEDKLDRVLDLIPKVKPTR